MAEHHKRGRAVLGALLVVSGVSALVMLVFVNNCLSDACQKAIITIGLAGGAALSAMAQVAAVVGAWLFWTSVRRRKEP